MLFQEEPLCLALTGELAPLIKRHHKEISKHQDLELDPDFDRYMILVNANVYKVFTVRNEGELVGYAGFFVSPTLHFKNVIQAVCDLIYIVPEIRGLGIGKSFISFMDKELKTKSNVDVVYHHVPVNNNWSVLLKDKGYEIHDYIYSRRI